MVTTWDTATLVQMDIDHMLHPVTNLHQHARTGPLVLARGVGSKIYDTDGKEYIDAFAGLWNVNVGHGRVELAEAARSQIETLAFAPTFFGLATPPAIELAAKLADMFPGSVNHFNFTSGGAESNETAIKIARYFWSIQGKADKIKILSRLQGYHGIAMGALSATGIQSIGRTSAPDLKDSSTSARHTPIAMRVDSMRTHSSIGCALSSKRRSSAKEPEPSRR